MFYIFSGTTRALWLHGQHALGWGKGHPCITGLSQSISELAHSIWADEVRDCVKALFKKIFQSIFNNALMLSRVSFQILWAVWLLWRRCTWMAFSVEAKLNVGLCVEFGCWIMVPVQYVPQLSYHSGKSRSHVRIKCASELFLNFPECRFLWWGTIYPSMNCGCAPGRYGVCLESPPWRVVCLGLWEYAILAIFGDCDPEARQVCHPGWFVLRVWLPHFLTTIVCKIF